MEGVSDKKKILVVEDDVFMIELLAKELMEAGFGVVSAKTGKEAIEKFSQARPDLILLDLILPDQSGFDALREIRGMPGGDTMKVVVLSNLSEGRDVDEGKRLGVNAHLVKANTPLPEVVAKVQEVLNS